VGVGVGVAVGAGVGVWVGVGVEVGVGVDVGVGVGVEVGVGIGVGGGAGVTIATRATSTAASRRTTISVIPVVSVVVNVECGGIDSPCGWPGRAPADAGSLPQHGESGKKNGDQQGSVVHSTPVLPTRVRNRNLNGRATAR
jgi:hypothetical protein